MGSDPVQVGITGWIIDYPAPGTFFEQLMDEALSRQATDPSAADRLREQVDRRVTDAAAWVADATPRQVRFLGERVGNHEHHPVWQTQLDQLWVR